LNLLLDASGIAAAPRLRNVENVAANERVRDGAKRVRAARCRRAYVALWRPARARGPCTPNKKRPPAVCLWARLVILGICV